MQAKQQNGNQEQKVKKKRKRKKRPIERDDFPAPPFPYARRRHWSEPLRSSDSSEDEDGEFVETVESSSEHEEEPDLKLEQTENTLKKISTGMASVFLQDLAVEKQRKKSAQKFVDPRSAARTPAANREPQFRLRYEQKTKQAKRAMYITYHFWRENSKCKQTADTT